MFAFMGLSRLLLAAKIISHQTIWRATAPGRYNAAPTRHALARHDRPECLSGQRFSAFSSQARRAFAPCAHTDGTILAKIWPPQGAPVL